MSLTLTDIDEHGCFHPLEESTMKYVWFLGRKIKRQITEDLLVGHRSLIKNKTQTAIIFLILFPAPLSILYK